MMDDVLMLPPFRHLSIPTPAPPVTETPSVSDLQVSSKLSSVSGNIRLLACSAMSLVFTIRVELVR